MMRNKPTIIVAVLTTIFISPVAHSQDQCSIHQSEIDKITQTYKKQFDELEKDSNALVERANNLSDDTAENILNVDVDFTMREKRIVFDTPSIVMKPRRIVFGLPKTSFNLRTISFDIPKTRFENKKTGQYPETRCVDTWISLPFGGKTKGVPKCTVTWSDIITKVPVTYMETTQISTKIPEFVWDNTEIVVSIPETFMERQEIFIKVPELKVTDVSAERKAVQSEGESITSRSETIQKKQREELISATTSLYDCYESELVFQRQKAINEFKLALDEISSSIQEMKQAGIDPSNINTPEGTVNLIQIEADIVSKRAEAMQSFEESLQQMKEQREKTLDNF